MKRHIFTNKLELKIFDYELLLNDSFYQELEKISVDTISFGSESCYLQLPDPSLFQEIFSRLERFRKKFNVPILFESHFHKVAGIIDSIIDTIYD